MVGVLWRACTLYFFAFDMFDWNKMGGRWEELSALAVQESRIVPNCIGRTDRRTYVRCEDEWVAATCRDLLNFFVDAIDVHMELFSYSLSLDFDLNRVKVICWVCAFRVWGTPRVF